MRILMTTIEGEGHMRPLLPFADAPPRPAELGPLPNGVHAERWVHEAAVLPHVQGMVSHGGAGSVRTALSAGVPLAVLPRFGDQPRNARAVGAAGGRGDRPT